MATRLAPDDDGSPVAAPLNTETNRALPLPRRSRRPRCGRGRRPSSDAGRAPSGRTAAASGGRQRGLPWRPARARASERWPDPGTCGTPRGHAHHDEDGCGHASHGGDGSLPAGRRPRCEGKHGGEGFVVISSRPFLWVLIGPVMPSSWADQTGVRGRSDRRLNSTWPPDPPERANSSDRKTSSRLLTVQLPDIDPLPSSIGSVQLGNGAGGPDLLLTRLMVRL